MTVVTTNWGNHTVTLNWVEKENLPSNAVITTGHGVCFSQGEAFLVNVDSRGWDFPGGHMEDEETSDECFLREAMEEACVTGKLTLLGYVAVDNRNDILWDSSMYPAVGYQAYYRMDVTDVYPFIHEFEVNSRLLVKVEDIPAMHQNWNPIYDTILARAINAAS